MKIKVTQTTEEGAFQKTNVNYAYLKAIMDIVQNNMRQTGSQKANSARILHLEEGLYTLYTDNGFYTIAISREPDTVVVWTDNNDPLEISRTQLTNQVADPAPAQHDESSVFSTNTKILDHIAEAQKDFAKLKQHTGWLVAYDQEHIHVREYFMRRMFFTEEIAFEPITSYNGKTYHRLTADYNGTQIIAFES